MESDPFRQFFYSFPNQNIVEKKMWVMRVIRGIYNMSLSCQSTELFKCLIYTQQNSNITLFNWVFIIYIKFHLNNHTTQPIDNIDLFFKIQKAIHYNIYQYHKKSLHNLIIIEQNIDTVIYEYMDIPKSKIDELSVRILETFNRIV